VDAFLSELDELCKKHNFSISAEQDSGDFYLRRYDDADYGALGVRENVTMELFLIDDPELPDPERPKYEPPPRKDVTGTIQAFFETVKWHKNNKNQK